MPRRKFEQKVNRKMNNKKEWAIYPREIGMRQKNIKGKKSSKNSFSLSWGGGIDCCACIKRAFCSCTLSVVHPSPAPPLRSSSGSRTHTYVRKGSPINGILMAYYQTPTCFAERLAAASDTGSHTNLHMMA